MPANCAISTKPVHFLFTVMLAKRTNLIRQRITKQHSLHDDSNKRSFFLAVGYTCVITYFNYLIIRLYLN